MSAPIESCPFCAYKGPSPILSDYGHVVVFEPLNPVTLGHVLVVPKAHVEHAGSNLRLTGDVFAHAADWAVRNALPDWNLITSVGPVATQTIKHLHVHVIPRRLHDGLPLPWTMKLRPSFAERSAVHHARCDTCRSDRLCLTGAWFRALAREE